MTIRQFIASSLILSSSVLFGGNPDKSEHLFSVYGPTGIAMGVPLNEAINANTIDLRFQLGIRTRDFLPRNEWDMFIAYRQSAVWNIFGPSSPFRDVLFRPGFYATKNTENGRLMIGLEHLSNGRPFFGAPIATDDYDDGSRGMNYFTFEWRRNWTKDIIALNLKAGAGCGVGLDRHDLLFTQDLFLYYFGYLTADYMHKGKVMTFRGSVTPLWNKSIANITLETSWTIAEGWPVPFISFHYGYDETMCCCRADMKPSMTFRIGVVNTLILP